METSIGALARVSSLTLFPWISGHTKSFQIKNKSESLKFNYSQVFRRDSRFHLPRKLPHVRNKGLLGISSSVPSSITDVATYPISLALNDEASALIGVESCDDGSLLFKFGSEELANEMASSVVTANGNYLGPVVEGVEISVNSEMQYDEPIIVEGEFIVAKGEEFEGNDCVPEPMDETSEPTIRCALHFTAGVASITHPDRVSRGSEDAYFMEGNWVGLADGVSTWADVGVNSGLYSKELMWNCLEVIRGRDVGSCDPRAVLEESHSRTDLQGSCTAVVAVLEGQTLTAANMGDSGFMVLRGPRVVVRSRPMLHAFNTPFSIGHNGEDDPLEAEVYSVELEAGDILLLASDGLFDNVFEEEIVASLTQSFAEDKEPQIAAKLLAQVANKQSMLTTGNTPFREDAHAAGQQFDGGKRDDITCIVAYVS